MEIRNVTRESGRENRGLSEVLLLSGIMLKLYSCLVGALKCCPEDLPKKKTCQNADNVHSDWHPLS